MKDWNVRVHRNGRSIEVGQVSERSESLARCAALSRFGVSEDELRGATLNEFAIYPDDEFGRVARLVGSPRRRHHCLL